MLTQLDMISIRVGHWKAAVEWYRDVLGLTPVGLHDDPWCLMTFPRGTTAIALDGTNPVEAGPGNCIPNIRVEDLPGTLAQLASRGVQIERALVDDADEGYRIATIRDLEGNRLNLYDYAPETRDP